MWGVFQKEADLKPHQSRYWLTPPPTEPEEERQPKIEEICTLYQEAIARTAAGERIMSTDEMTGVQALQRKYPGLPLVPGKVERREFEYVRHGTLAFIVNFDVAKGQVVAPSVGKTRTEAREKTGQAIKTGFQHSGRFNGDWLKHFDNRGASKGDQFKFAMNKDGGFAKRGNDALEVEAFEKLLVEIESHLRRIGGAIYAGDVSVAPFRKGSETACDYCDFRPFCRFDPWVQPYRALKTTENG